MSENTLADRMLTLAERLEDVEDDLDDGVTTSEPAYWIGRDTAAKAIRRTLAGWNQAIVAPAEEEES